MSSDRQRAIRTVTDPRTLRALAHPLRLTLLDLIDREGQLTATRAAEVTGENSANCSFHLRLLAKSGYVEPAPAADGRERPWRRTTAGARVPITSDPQLLAATAAVGSLVVDRLAANAIAYMERGDADVAWQDASLITDDTLHLTREELAKLSGEIGALIERHAQARTPGRRTDGETRAVRVAALLFPLPALPESARR